MTLSDGNIKTFEVPIDKFNELRYNVAKVGADGCVVGCDVWALAVHARMTLCCRRQVLQEMTQLERHPVLKLAFDLDKQQMDDQKRERGSA